ncbi:voltage-gated potassium channel [Naumannella cuiyingiana]|uniref:Voltage-gated potassium channel n=1 Tax=Naumannella cuiyingiana TaxID=1347891 RepID=A0A7Z0D692_9ACTN|nr:potassium channel family protein [Naumannella cuiyingiana]NYI69583.1 voltage-gated potassium channel [Naumannella cuiyingiana]
MRNPVRAGWSAQKILVNLPVRDASPVRQLAIRALVAVALVTISTALVWFDRDAYIDNTNSDGVSLIDAIYYSTVTVTTTGYGDITPIEPHSRLINALVVTPLRIAFLVLLVGTTLEVLANQGRRMWLDNRWRKRMRNHTVVVGYGTKGRSAVGTLRRHDADLAKVVVIDQSPVGIEDASLDGVASIQGDGTRRDVLRRAEISKAREVIITLDRDDAAILCTLTVRQLNPSAHVVVAVREQENGSLLRQSGADSVVTSSDAVGRLLGLSAVSPDIGTTIEDLLASGEGLEVAERLVRPDEVGRSPVEIAGEQVLAVVRNKTLRRFYDPSVKTLATGDQLIVVRRSEAEVARLRGGESSAPGPGRESRAELD